MKFLAPILLRLKAWFLSLFQPRAFKAVEPIDKQENLEMIKNIRIMACVLGMTRLQIELDIRKELTGDNLKLAYQELDLVFVDRERIARKDIRRFRQRNGMSFSKVVKKNLK